MIHPYIKPEPIILPIILSRISHNFHPLFFIYSHAVTYHSILFLKFDCVKLHIAAAKIVYFSAIKIDNIMNSSYKVALLLSYSSSD